MVRSCSGSGVRDGEMGTRATHASDHDVVVEQAFAEGRILRTCISSTASGVSIDVTRL
jgi:hypothetical protein